MRLIGLGSFGVAVLGGVVGMAGCAGTPTQTAAPAANANLFVIYLAEFWPAAKEPWPRFVILTLLVGVLALGEGWHNNHHAFPSSARHGLRWWQLDVSYWIIRGLELCRLAWKVRLPTAHELHLRSEAPAAATVPTTG